VPATIPWYPLDFPPATIKIQAFRCVARTRRPSSALCTLQAANAGWATGKARFTPKEQAHRIYEPRPHNRLSPSLSQVLPLMLPL
jgi:hypothetical protein